jgi:hypothetical protein
VIGAKGEDSSKMLRIFFVRCFAVEAFLVLREIALGGDPAGVAEEAPAAPLGKRSHLGKSTAVFKEILKTMTFSAASNGVRRLTDRPQASEPPGTEINCI